MGGPEVDDTLYERALVQAAIFLFVQTIPAFQRISEPPIPVVGVSAEMEGGSSSRELAKNKLLNVWWRDILKSASNGAIRNTV